jgi:hypothetical protein
MNNRNKLPIVVHKKIDDKGASPKAKAFFEKIKRIR